MYARIEEVVSIVATSPRDAWGDAVWTPEAARAAARWGDPTHAPAGPLATGDRAIEPAREQARRRGVSIVAVDLSAWAYVPVLERAIKPQRHRNRRCSEDPSGLPWPSTIGARGPIVAPSRLALPDVKGEALVVFLVSGRTRAWGWYQPCTSPPGPDDRYSPLELGGVAIKP